MRIKPLVCKEAYLLATLHDMGCPYVDLKYFPHVYYLDPHLAPLLYLRYRIDREGLWEHIFTKIVSGEEDELVRELRSIEIYKWDEIKDVLSKVAMDLSSLHEKIREKFVSLSRKVFGFEKFFEEVYVVLGFYPRAEGFHGSTGFTKELPAIAMFVNNQMKAEEVLDVVYHEILHMLIRLNNVPELIGNKALEETLLDFICPDGYLSVALGLKRTVKASPKHYQEFKELYDKLGPKIRKYFEDKWFEKLDILEYLKPSLSG